MPNDYSIDENTALRPHDPILEKDIVVTRTFDFDRRQGAWQINDEFFNPRRCSKDDEGEDVTPTIDPEGIKAERWILKNKSGGWWHPIHIHLEHHEIQKMNGRTPPRTRQGKSDVSSLSGNGEAEIFMRFRTFEGPFAFHCHNLEHEDMRMMGVFEPMREGGTPRLDGISEIDPLFSGIDETLTCEDIEQQILFEHVGDTKLLEGRGVGIPCDDFDGGGGE